MGHPGICCKFCRGQETVSYTHLRPSLLPRLYPCVIAVERRRKWARRVFIDQQGRLRPFVNFGADPVPIGVLSIGKDKDHWPAIISKVGLATRSVQGKIRFVEQLEIFNRLVRRPFVILGFVVHHRNMEFLFAGDGLQQGIAAIDKGFSIAIPIHDKPGNPQGLGVADLLANDNGIVRGIVDGDVPGMAEPCFIDGQDLRLSLIHI